MGPNKTQTGNDLSNEVTTLLVLFSMVYFNMAISLIGLGGNAVNIVVFFRQGFSDNINISLFVLAIADLGSLLTGLMFSLCSIPAFADSDLPLVAFEFQSVVASFTRGTFSRIASSITAYVTVERCLCVMLPLKVRSVVTPKVTALVLVVIVTSLGLTLIPFYLVAGLGWKFDPLRNRTVLGMVFLNYNGPADVNVTISIHTFVQIASYCVIIMFTVILMMKLRQQSEWRRANAGKPKNSVLGPAERKTSRTLVLVTAMAVTYLVSYGPSIASLLAHFAEEEFSVYGSLVNYFTVAMAFCMLLESVNSTVTVFVYYSMSAKYRVTLRALCCVKWCLIKPDNDRT